MNIGFFDSGVGGATILKKALKEINGDFFYLADNKNAPYGVKEKNKVKEYSFKAVETLLKRNCKIIVIACNTATSVAIKEIRQKYNNIIFIGTEPAVKLAKKSFNGKRILVTATTITINGRKLLNLVDQLSIKEYVDMLALDKLVEYAENGNVDKETINRYLYSKLKDYDLSKYSHIVLGCTHFPLFKDNFNTIMPSTIKLLDSSEGVVRNLKKQLESFNYNTNEYDPKINLLLSKKEINFINNFKNIIENKNVNVEII